MKKFIFVLLLGITFTFAAAKTIDNDVGKANIEYSVPSAQTAILSVADLSFLSVSDFKQESTEVVSDLALKESFINYYISKAEHKLPDIQHSYKYNYLAKRTEKTKKNHWTTSSGGIPYIC